MLSRTASCSSSRTAVQLNDRASPSRRVCAEFVDDDGDRGSVVDSQPSRGLEKSQARRRALEVT